MILSLPFEHAYLFYGNLYCLLLKRYDFRSYFILVLVYWLKCISIAIYSNLSCTLIATGQEAAVENAPIIINLLIDLTTYQHMMVINILL